MIEENCERFESANLYRTLCHIITYVVQWRHKTFLWSKSLSDAKNVSWYHRYDRLYIAVLYYTESFTSFSSVSAQSKYVLQHETKQTKPKACRSCVYVYSAHNMRICSSFQNLICPHSSSVRSAEYVCRSRTFIVGQQYSHLLCRSNSSTDQRCQIAVGILYTPMMYLAQSY